MTETSFGPFTVGGGADCEGGREGGRRGRRGREEEKKDTNKEGRVKTKFQSVRKKTYCVTSMYDTGTFEPITNPSIKGRTT